MSKKSNNIPLSKLAERAFALCPGSLERKPLETKWYPQLRDVEVIVQRMNIPTPLLEKGQFHQLFVLKIHLSGESKGYVENNFYDFRPGEGFLIFPFQMHRISSVSPEGQLRLIVNFTASQEDMLAMEALRNRVFRLDAEDRKILSLMLSLCSETGTGPQREIVFCLTDFLTGLLEKSQQTSLPPVEKIPRLIFDYVYAHYREGLSVKEIADRLGYSETGVRQMFLRETGRTPGAFMKELRLLDAARLLHNSEKPVQDISRECGFSNPFVFSRAFRHKFGHSPKEFRESVTERNRGKSSR